MHRDVATARTGTVEGRPARSVHRLLHFVRTTSDAAGSRKVLARRGAVLGASVLFFGALYANKSGDAALADAVVIMFVVPVTILALEFGLRGGILGAAVAILLAGAWHSADAGGISDLGFAVRAITFLVVGAGIGQVADVRRRLERDLRHARDMSLHMIGTMTRDGVLRGVNPAWEQVLGIPRATLLSRRMVAFVHADDVAATNAATAQVLHSDMVNFRNRLRAADGTYRWLEWNARAEPAEGLIHVTARDLTAQICAEELLATHAETLERMVVTRTADLDRERLQTLRRLALAAEYRDDDTRLHTDRVGVTSASIAAQLELPEELVAQIGEAAPLHDIGKIGIRDAILLKPGRLTPEEFDEMRRHAEIGASLLSGSDFATLQLAEEIALTHHERWDGAGYPAGLAGEAIPIAGRIVAVADVFDALTHSRPYKEAWSRDRALQTIHEGAGAHFDPLVVAAFERVQQQTASMYDGAARATPAGVASLG
jgi:PAS domain S-box-containing protein